MLIEKLYFNVDTFWIDLSGESWRIFALIIKFKDEDAINTRRYQQVFFIVKLRVVYKSEMRHIKMWLDHYIEVVHENELEF